MNGMNDDFRDEFDSIKEMSSEMLENDKLVSRIRLQNKLKQLNSDNNETTVNNAQPSTTKNQDVGEITTSSRDTNDNADSKPKSAFLKSFKSLRKQIKRKPDSNLSSSAKIRNVKVTNSNAPDSSPVKNPSQPSSVDNQQSSAIETPSPLNILSSPMSAIEKQNTRNKDQNDTLTSFSPLKYTSDTPTNLTSPTKPHTKHIVDKLSNNMTEVELERGQSPVVLPREIPTGTNGGNDMLPDSIQISHNDIAMLKSMIMKQLVGHFNNLLQSSLINIYKDIYTMFEHTIKDNEGHSVLLVGPRSSGKTVMINKAITELDKQFHGKFITIRLNAFIHADDNVALREIAKQLDCNVNTNDELNQMSFEQRSINDTFSNILSTLDKNSDANDSNEKISIIFIIDEFDKFTSNNKQTLLYNLFDLCQTSTIPICVVGVSTNITTRESLEKRVRSRFSQRVISINKSPTLQAFWDDAKLSITLNEENINKLENPNYGEAWNNSIENLYRRKTSNLFKIVFRNYYSLKNFKEFNNNCMYGVSRITSQTPFLNDEDFLVYDKNQSRNHVQSMVSSLSTLELLLTIAGARWIEKFNSQVINFNLAYGEYKEMMKQYNIESTTASSSSALDSTMLTNIKVNQKIWSAKVLKNLWEILYKLGLLLDATGITTNNEGHVITNVNLNKNLIIEASKMVQLDITLDELAVLIPESNSFKRLTRL
jgi:origin recognition complex subunit 4